MRILIAGHSGEVIGGAETYLRAVLPALAARGHQLALLHEQPIGHDLPRVDAWVRGMAVWCADGRPEDLPREAVDWSPDVVYVQGLRRPEREAALADRFPTVLYAHAYYGACISGAKRFARPFPRPCQRVLGPPCLALYLPRRCGGLNPISMWQAYGIQRKRQALLTRHRAVLVASRHMREEYRRHGVRDDRLHLAPLFPPGLEHDPAAR